ncbi:MAG TPA: DinB family protein [Bryobacteraceae bacterium]|nr:DinB family protein [Bryobacteraceae bacterium]
MSIAQSLLPEFDHEMANTRRTLERIPENKLDFAPDPKSMPLGRLAGHIAEMVGWGATTMQTDSLNLTPEEFKPLVAASRQQLLSEFDKNVAAARQAIESGSDADYMKPWTLSFQGNVIFTMPRVAVLRSMMMNHVIHHRAQLTVYYRMTGVPVPSLYGPSADEQAAPAAA